MRELHSKTANRRRDLDERLGNVNGAIERAVDALLAGTPSRALQDRLTKLEAERDEIEAMIAAVARLSSNFTPKPGMPIGTRCGT